VSNNSEPLQGIINWIRLHFVVFNLGLFFFFLVVFIPLVAFSPYCPTTTSTTTCTPDSWVIIWAMATFFFAGGLGGITCNLRGIFEYYYEKEFLPDSYIEPYCVRPWMGAGCGLITFFLLSFLNSALSNTNSEAWTTFSGRVPYIGLAILAGFGSHEFMERVKEIVKTTFSSNASGPQTEVSTTTIGTWDANGKGPENIQVNKDEIVLLIGKLDDKINFKWQIFQQGQTPSKPDGESVAIRFSGGNAETRLAKAREHARLRAEEEGKTNWEELEKK
jgi:hypothetical protein